jgi:hypothetical protein
MGKPIVLGKVRIDIEGLFCVDRERRYSLDGLLAAERYAGKWTADAGIWSTSRRWFPREAGSAAVELPADQQPLALRDALRAKLIAHGGQARLRALEQLGETVPELPVCYPVSEQQQPYSEIELYRWFTRRQPPQPAALPPLDGQRLLPALP